MDINQPLIEEKENSTINSKGQCKQHNIFFTRITKFIRLIKSQKEDEQIQNEQTHPFIPQNTSVDSQIEKLEEYLSNNQEHFQPTNFNLFKIYVHMTGLTLVKGFILSMINEFLSASGIYLLDYATDKLKEFTGSSNEKLILSFILLGIVVNYTIRNLIFVQYEWINFRWQALCKTTLQYLVYKKSLKVKNFCKKSNLVAQEIQQQEDEKDNKEEGSDESVSFQKSNPDINNILTVDIEESMEMFWGINQSAGSFVVISITLVFIYYKIGKSILHGIYMLIGAMAFCIIVGYVMNLMYDKMYSCKDDRISLSKDVIEGMKSIKYLGWERIFSKKIQNIRKREFKFISIMRSLDGFFTTFFMSLTYLLLYSFIVSYVNDGNELSGSNVFTIIALFGNLAYPMGMIPFSVRCITKARISFLRIKNFLNMNEINESDVINDIGQQDSSQKSLNSNDECQIAIKVKQLQFKWPNKEAEIDESDKNKVNEDTPEQSKDNLDQQKQILQNEIEDTLSNKSKDSVLFNLSIEEFQIQKGSLNFVIGKIGKIFIFNLNYEFLTFKVQDSLSIQQIQEIQINYTINLHILSHKISNITNILNYYYSRRTKKQGKRIGDNNEDLQYYKFNITVIYKFKGSGKTALLLSILNEMEKIEQKFDPSLLQNNFSNKEIMKMTNFENKIFVNGSTGYVSQNHWLQTKSIRDNILFGLPYDESFYNRCLDLCSLKIDLSHFYKGDQKVISSDGNNLSGGQRQRISLCRALYQDKDIYLFDDIFSSLDAHVAEFIFHKAIVEYLIKEKKKTVILVSSHYSFLENESVSKIIYLKNGSIISDKQEIQNYIFDSQKEEKQRKNQDLLNENDEQEEEISQDILKLDQNGTTNRLQLQKIPSDQDSNCLILKKNNSKKINYKDKDEQFEEGEGENEEFREKGEIKMETLKTYFKSQNYVALIFLLLFFALVETATLFIDFWLRDKLTYENEQDSAFYFINKLFSGFSQTFLFLTMLQFGLTFLASTMYVITALLSSYKLFRKLNDAILYSKMVFFDKNPVGRIINRLSDDTNSIDDDLPLYFEITLELLAYAIGYPVGISIQFPWMSIFFVFAFIISYFISKMYRYANREVKRLNSVNKGKLLSHISESCKGIVTVRSMQKQVYMTKLYVERLTNNVNTFLLSLSMEMWMFVRLLLISNCIQLTVVLTAIILIVTESDINQNVIVLCLSYGILFSGSICDVVNFICLTEQEMISVERVRQYFDNEKENLNEIKPKLRAVLTEEVNRLKPEDLNQDYSIIFNNLSITYDEINEQNSNSVQYALKNFDLKIKKGEKIAFCGRTGSGKTSILNCLYRLYEYQKGQILINKNDIQNMSLQELRSKMAIIPQFGFLYNASLKHNIDPLGQNSEEEIQGLISSIQEQEIQPNTSNDCFKNLQFEIQEGGKNLSNGQKQIINFIRVALRQTEIICLDEATSNMDPKTDQLIHQKLFELSEGKTLLVITHRLENIDKFDRIVVLDSGNIVECGNYQQLKSIEGGFFNKLIQKK